MVLIAFNQLHQNKETTSTVPLDINGDANAGCSEDNNQNTPDASKDSETTLKKTSFEEDLLEHVKQSPKSQKLQRKKICPGTEVITSTD
ncbi:hypothetical protein JTB14_007737 [Gonioctena quinquepunctata]|nr:hypothetical protein JTB14_007737 [Gonioctena quinquepunctata]